jgi:dephospho-CoA kinase
MIIGLTGGIGCGKTTVAEYFRSLGANVISSDEITRQLVTPEQPATRDLVKHFGETILKPDGTLDRNKLRVLIFESPKERKWLERLLHPLIKDEIVKLARDIPKGQYLLVEAPLLIESDFQGSVNRILVVDCNTSQQIERISKRDGFLPHEVQAIIDTQVDRGTRLALANDVIENEGDREELKNKVKTLHLYYIELAR